MKVFLLCLLAVGVVVLGLSIGMAANRDNRAVHFVIGGFKDLNPKSPNDIKK